MNVRELHKDSAVIFTPQKGPQELYIRSPIFETVYGGARGGGKTFGSLGDFLLHQQAYGKHANGLVLRKTREALSDTIEIARRLYSGIAVWRQSGSMFRFKSGAILRFAFCERESDTERYQGWSLTRLYVEELTQFEHPEPILRLFATLRSDAGVPCLFRATCNPGGPGHSWVKERYIDRGAFKVVSDDEGNERIFIPARVSDNPALLANDPNYTKRLKMVGSPELVKAWLEGDWDVVEGAFFPEFSVKKHVLKPFPVPEDWMLFRAADWGSSAPFVIQWYAAAGEGREAKNKYGDTLYVPKGAIICYREWYGGHAGHGLKMPAEKVGKGIVEREDGEKIRYGVADPAIFISDGGPSIAERLHSSGAHFRRADNKRVATVGKLGGWDMLRYRLQGEEETGRPMIYFFDHCMNSIRTIPSLQHDELRPEDVDTKGDDHCGDTTRYACMSRPFIPEIMKSAPSKNGYDKMVEKAMFKGLEMS